MNTNLKIAHGVAAALALAAVSAPAAAAYVEPYDLTGSEPYTVFLSGATAQDKGMILLMRRLCSAGTMTRVQAKIGTATHQSMFCEANGTDTTGITAATKIVLHKNGGGSSNGVNSVADSLTVAFLNLSVLNATNITSCTVTTVASTTDFADYKNYVCASSLVTASNVIPDAGISDVEPSLLGWTSGVNGALTVTAGPMLTFGVPVSKNFRDALQTAQSTKLGAGCVGSDSEACMPNMTKAQIAAILSGATAAVNKFADDAGVVMANPAGGGGLGLCRRKSGSGTLAGTVAYFLNEGCVKTAQAVKTIVSGSDGDTVLAASTTAAQAVANRVNMYSSTNTVMGCLNANHTAGKYAIGMASMEFKPGTAYTGVTSPVSEFTADTANWGWVKVGGYAPTLLNTAQARYDFAFELSYQTRAAGLGANKATLFGLVKDTNLSALVLKELNASFAQSSGGNLWSTGLLAKPGTPTDPTGGAAGALLASEVDANPIAEWARSVATGTPNSCQPATPSKQTGLNF